MPKSAEEVLNLVHIEFIQPVRAYLSTHASKIKNSIGKFSTYDAMLRQVLGGIGSEFAGDAEGDAVINTLWNVLTTIVEPKASLRWVMLQSFSNMKFSDVSGGRSGHLMWTSRRIADDYLARGSRDKSAGLPAGVREVYNQFNSDWYNYSISNRDETLLKPVGFYNLLMNPRFYKPFKAINEDQKWYPQPLLVKRGELDKEKDKESLLPVLSIAALVDSLDGEKAIDDLRQDLIAIVQAWYSSKAAATGKDYSTAIEKYHLRISDFVAKTKSADRDAAVSKLKNALIEIYRKKGSKDNVGGSWSALADDTEAVGQLMKEVKDEEIIITFLYWLVQDPGWNYYYYFVYGSTPNTSGPSLGIATADPLGRRLEICSIMMLSALGKDLAMLETQVLAAEVAKGRMSYFIRLHTHTFTKGFTTPVHNEMLRLRGMMRDQLEEDAIERAGDRLRRFEYMMQSSEFLGVGEIDESDPHTYLVEPEEIDDKFFPRLIYQLKRSVEQSVKWRLNDLFDDPRFARSLDALDPAHATLFKRVSVVVGEPEKLSLCTDYALLAYHLQSLIQNAAEAIDLVATKESGQSIFFGCQQFREDDRDYIVFSVTNSAAQDTIQEKPPTRLGRLAQGLNTLQEKLRDEDEGELDISDMPPSGKSGGHQGVGLILAAMFCSAIRVYDKQLVPGRLKPKAYGNLKLSPPTAESPVTRFELRVPLSTPETEVVRIDRRVFGYATGEPSRKDDDATNPGETTEVCPLAKALAAAKTNASGIRVLVVDDDTADRQRFRFNIRRMGCFAELTKTASLLRNTTTTLPPDSKDSDEALLDNNRLFNDRVAFAWDAKAGAISPWRTILEFLTDANRKDVITVFLDLAWTRSEEDFFDRLRLVSKRTQYWKTIDDAKHDKPAAFLLLDQLALCEAKRGLVQIFVVTAYKSVNLSVYLREKYRDLNIRSFMKWSDEVRLRSIVEPVFR